MDGIRTLTKEQRAFIAGIIAKDCDGCDRLEIDRTLPEAVDAFLMRTHAVIDMPMSEFLQKLSDYFDAEEAHLSNRLNESGPNLAKPIQYWGPNEWQCAVTAMALYRHYLQREIVAVNDFLACQYVQNAEPLANVANNFAEACPNPPTPDTFWSGRLIRRITKEAEALIKT